MITWVLNNFFRDEENPATPRQQLGASMISSVIADMDLYTDYLYWREVSAAMLLDSHVVTSGAIVSAEVMNATAFARDEILMDSPVVISDATMLLSKEDANINSIMQLYTAICLIGAVSYINIATDGRIFPYLESTFIFILFIPFHALWFLLSLLEIAFEIMNISDGNRIYYMVVNSIFTIQYDIISHLHRLRIQQPLSRLTTSNLLWMGVFLESIPQLALSIILQRRHISILPEYQGLPISNICLLHRCMSIFGLVYKIAEAFDTKSDELNAQGRDYSHFLEAAREGNLALVESYLSKGVPVDWCGSEVLAIMGRRNFSMGGMRALHFAASGGHEDIVQLLTKDYSADLNVMNDVNDTPLHCACRMGQINIVDVLLKRKALVNIQNAKGMTPLHDTASQGHVECVASLLKYGANAYVKDRQGNTPLDLSLERQQVDIIPFLAPIPTKEGRPSILNLLEKKERPTRKRMKINLFLGNYMRCTEERDEAVTGLYPFQLAAVENDLDLSFEFLRRAPYLMA